MAGWTVGSTGLTVRPAKSKNRIRLQQNCQANINQDMLVKFQVTEENYK